MFEFKLLCKKCGKEPTTTQMLKQVSTRSWQAREDTPCECGSLDYKSEIKVS